MQISDLLHEAARLETLSLAYPEKKDSAQILEGNVGEMVEQVVTMLKANTTVL